MATTTKKTDEALPSEAAMLAELQALRAQNQQMLDALIAQGEEIDAIKAQQAAPVFTPADTLSPVEAELNAELEALREEFADYPQIEVFQQRVVLGQQAAVDIRLRGDRSVLEDPIGQDCYWHLRWFNFGKPNRAEQAKAEGYVAVRWDDLQDQGMVGAGARLDDLVRRGDKGLEVLHKIPRKLYAYKQRRDAARQQGLLASERAMRDHVANRVASMAGATGGNASQAGDFAHDRITMTITPGATERVTL